MEDFSFPTVPAEQEPLCQLRFPLWFVSSIADQNKTQHHRRSFSSTEEAAKIAEALAMASSVLSEDGRVQFLNDEERMDMLWENFNEELCRMSGDHRRWAAIGDASSTSAATGSKTDSSRHGKAGASKSGSIIHHRRPSLLLILKVLKKLFLIHKTSSSKRKQLH